MLYYKNGGKLLQVQEKLGHKSILTTTIYTHLINFEADAYDSAIAETVDEARKLVEAGFEFVCDMDGYKLFRKPRARKCLKHHRKGLFLSNGANI